MSNLPERYQPYATPAGQHPTNHLPAPLTGPIELHTERQPVIYVPSAEQPGLMVAIEKRHIQPMQPAPARDLTPQPLLDPMAQRFVAGGVGIGTAGAGVGWGMGQVLAGFALGASGLAVILAGIILACLVRGGRGSINVRKTVVVQQKWFGTTNITN